jgi:glycosyltransferase involved in cell wall biosynthesis
VLLEAAQAVSRRVPGVRFWVVGDGPSRGEFQALADGLGLARAVRWLGHRQDVEAVLAASDLFVLPSLHDALPTVLLEAMAAGVPAIASDTGGIPEIIGDGSGVLVPPGDAVVLGREIERLLFSADGGAAQSRRALASVRSRFSVESWVARLLRLYASAKRAPAGAAP